MRRMMTHARVLLVSDDVETLDLVSGVLSADGCEVEPRGPRNVRDGILYGAVDAIVLGVVLSDGSGADLCRRWREQGVEAPVLLLTVRNDVRSRVAGLDAGADDCLSRPFAVAELRARLRALLRRGGSSVAERVLTVGEVEIDLQRRQAWIGSDEAPLTPREFDVLARLARGDGRVVTRKDLLADVWGAFSVAAAASLDVILARLRRKLERRGHEALIRTVRGVGYALRSERADRVRDPSRQTHHSLELVQRTAVS